MIQSPTRVRFGMITATTLVAVMLYLDRVCLSIVGEQIKADQYLTDKQFANLLSAFFWAYALCQIPAGWLGDRFGPRRVLSAYLFLWSACTGLIGAVSGFAALFALRLGCGAFEAGAYPLATSVVRRWIPRTSRGTASGFVAVGGRIGGAVAPVLTVALAAGATDGWRSPFFLYGGIGMLGAVGFYFWYRDEPRLHPAVNDAEARLIGGDSSPERTASTEAAGPIPCLAIVTSRALWLNSFVQFAANFAWVFIITLFPSYLKQVFDTPLSERAIYQSLPLYAGIFGMLLGGPMTDRITERLGLRWGRAAPIAASRLVVGGAYFACLAAHDPLIFTALMCVVACATDIGTAPTWAWSQDVGGKHVGAVVGWSNMWGNVGAAIAPLAFQRLLTRHPDHPTAAWQSAFLFCGIIQVVAMIAALGIDARHPIVPRDSEPSQ